MNIYVTRDGQNYGPYLADSALQMIHQGQLSPNDLACPEGGAEWVPLGKILNLPLAAPHPAPAQAAPLAAAVRPAVPVAQPATAIPGHAPQTVPLAQGGVAPGSLSAQYALRQAWKRASSACTLYGLAAALTVLFLGLPLIAWSAGGSGFFGETLGVKWASIVGLPIGLLCLWWCFAQKGKAASAKSQFFAMRGGFM